jgi:hypothetical protein
MVMPVIQKQEKAEGRRRQGDRMKSKRGARIFATPIASLISL